jgi:hypothetical protein
VRETSDVLTPCDFLWASRPGLDTLFARHSQIASQGTGAVNVCSADMAMY